RKRRRTDRHGRRFVRRHGRENCFAGERCDFVSHYQSIRAREWIIDGNRGETGLNKENRKAGKQEERDRISEPVIDQEITNTERTKKIPVFLLSLFKSLIPVC